MYYFIGWANSHKVTTQILLSSTFFYVLLIHFLFLFLFTILLSFPRDVVKYPHKGVKVKGEEMKMKKKEKSFINLSNKRERRFLFSKFTIGKGIYREAKESAEAGVELR